MTYHTFQDRFEYLALRSGVGQETFGFDRYLNQKFYQSYEWKSVRDFVIARDLGCDLAADGYEIYDKILVHHMNPMTPEDVISHADWTVDPEFLITTCMDTHNAIHYGGSPKGKLEHTPRLPGDTKLW
jgi:hypothetical protein